MSVKGPDVGKNANAGKEPARPRPFQGPSGVRGTSEPGQHQATRNGEGRPIPDDSAQGC